MENKPQSSRVTAAMGSFAILGVLAVATLDGPLRLVTLLMLAAFAVRTWIAHLQQKANKTEEKGDGQKREPY